MDRRLCPAMTIDRMATPPPDLGFVHRFIPGDGAKPPLLLLHGTGGDEIDLLPLAARVAPGRTVLSPRGKVLEHGMPRFFRRSAEGQWDLADLKARTAELADFLARARAAYGIGRPVALGYSNGANIAWPLMLAEPTALAGAVLMRAMLPFDPRPLPDLSGLPVLMLTGRHDQLIPPQQAGLLAALLGEAGADVTYEVLEADHGLTEEDLALAAEWLIKHG
jgi:phospholipase/carboxylesterase